MNVSVPPSGAVHAITPSHAGDENNAVGSPSPRNVAVAGEEAVKQLNSPAGAQGPPSQAQPILQADTIIKNKWKISTKIGQGAFGETYAGVDLCPQELEDGTKENSAVAVKVERFDRKKMVLKLEVMALRRLQVCPYVVRYRSSGRQDDFNFLVMERLGENLAELRKRTSHGCFFLPTTLRVGMQMLEAIEGCHKLSYIHRDIKPSNFVIGKSGHARRRSYLIDFGLARKYRLPNGEMRPPRKSAGFRGTARYASINSHQGKELSRRDDLWSLFYVLVEFAKGQLPWRKLKDKDQIGDMKMEATNIELTRGLPCAQEFQDFMSHLQVLNYADDPDYRHLHDLLSSAFSRLGFSYDHPFDWESDQDDKDSALVLPAADPPLSPGANNNVNPGVMRRMIQNLTSPRSRARDSVDVTGAGGAGVGGGGVRPSPSYDPARLSEGAAGAARNRGSPGRAGQSGAGGGTGVRQTSPPVPGRSLPMLIHPAIEEGVGNSYPASSSNVVVASPMEADNMAQHATTAGSAPVGRGNFGPLHTGDPDDQGFEEEDELPSPKQPTAQSQSDMDIPAVDDRYAQGQQKVAPAEQPVELATSIVSIAIQRSDDVRTSGVSTLVLATPNASAPPATSTNVIDTQTASPTQPPSLRPNGLLQQVPSSSTAVTTGPTPRGQEGTVISPTTAMVVPTTAVAAASLVPASTGRTPPSSSAASNNQTQHKKGKKNRRNNAADASTSGLQVAEDKRIGKRSGCHCVIS